MIDKAHVPSYNHSEGLNARPLVPVPDLEPPVAALGTWLEYLKLRERVLMTELNWVRARRAEMEKELAR